MVDGAGKSRFSVNNASADFFKGIMESYREANWKAIQDFIEIMRVSVVTGLGSRVEVSRVLVSIMHLLIFQVYSSYNPSQ